MPAATPCLVRPTAAVLAIVARGDSLLLVRRANPPDQGLWGFPGGRIEPGEAYLDAALRELDEETGVAAEASRLLTVLDFHARDLSGDLTHHFAMIAVLCQWRSGEGVAADDALEARWFSRAELGAVGVAGSKKVGYLADLAFMVAGFPD